MDRRLDVSELAFHAAANRQRTVCVIAARLRGVPDPAQLRAALEVLACRHPLLRVRVIDAEVPRFCSDDVPALPLRVVARASEDAWVHETVRELNHPFSLHVGPLMRLVLVAGESASELLVVYHHMIGDGLAGRVMLRDLFAAMRSPERGLLPLSPQPGLCEQLTLRGALPGFAMVGDAIDRAADSMILARAQLGLVIEPLRRAAVPTHTMAETHALDPAILQALVHRARQEACTVGGALGAMLLQSTARARRRRGSARIGCATSIDLRERLGARARDDVGIQAYAPTLLYSVDPDESPWNLARRMSARARGARRVFVPQFAGLTMRLGRPWAHAMSDSIFTDALQSRLDAWVVLSNVGRLPAIEGCGEITVLEVRMFAAMPGIDVVLVAQTYAERLSLNFIYTTPEARPGLAAAAVSGVLERLVQLPA